MKNQAMAVVFGGLAAALTWALFWTAMVAGLE
jgi:hypothetical protein